MNARGFAILKTFIDGCNVGKSVLLVKGGYTKENTCNISSDDLYNNYADASIACSTYLNFHNKEEGNAIFKVVPIYTRGDNDA